MKVGLKKQPIGTGFSERYADAACVHNSSRADHPIKLHMGMTTDDYGDVESFEDRQEAVPLPWMNCVGMSRSSRDSSDCSRTNRLHLNHNLPNSELMLWAEQMLMVVAARAGPPHGVHRVWPVAPVPEASDAELEFIYGPLGQPIVAYAHIHRPYVRCLAGRIIANTGSVSLIP